MLRDISHAVNFLKIALLRYVLKLFLNEKPVLSNCAGLKSFFETFRFRDGLVRTLGVTVALRNKLYVTPPPPPLLLLYDPHIYSSSWYTGSYGIGPPLSTTLALCLTCMQVKDKTAESVLHET